MSLALAKTPRLTLSSTYRSSAKATRRLVKPKASIVPVWSTRLLTAAPGPRCHVVHRKASPTLWQIKLHCGGQPPKRRPHREQWEEQAKSETSRRRKTRKSRNKEIYR